MAKTSVSGRLTQQPRATVSLSRWAKIGGVVAAMAGFALVYQTQVPNQQADMDGIAYVAEDLDYALEKAASADKLCLLKFTSPYCYPCRSLEQQIRSKDGLAEIVSAQYIPIRVTAWSPEQGRHKLIDKYQVTTFPTILVTDPEGREIGRYYGDVDPGYLADQLQELAALRVAPREKRLNQPGHRLFRSDDPFGLVVRQENTYEAAYESAAIEARGWNQDVWIVPTDDNQYQVVIGTFETREEARTVRRVVKMLDATPADITRLKLDPVKYW
ncbi:MAG: thioredoxin family protein [Bacteroidia bacterium]|nr:thioredoxin family protein [Bacteroidia bacterium]